MTMNSIRATNVPARSTNISKKVGMLAVFMIGCAVAGGEQHKDPPGQLGLGRQGLNDTFAENARTDGVVPRTRWDRLAFGNEPTLGSVEGFSTQFSVAPGDTVQFKVKTPAGITSYRYEIYRLGWYGGDGARQVWPACDVTPPAQCPRITVSNNPVQGPCTRLVPFVEGGDPWLDVADCARVEIQHGRKMIT